jgi:hypothetical protein
LIKQDQAQQQNKTANSQIDGDFPRRRDAISAAPDSDQQESGNECELMKRVKEK